MKLLKRTGTVFDNIMWVLFLLACAMLAFAMLSVCLEVVMRYFLSRPLNWVVEIIRYMLLFITFLSAAWLLKTGKHVKIDLVLDRLNPRAQVRLNIVIYILSAIIWLVIAWYSGQLTWHLFQTGERIDTLLAPLKAPLVSIIPIGSFLLFIQSLRKAYTYLISRRESS